MAGAEQAKMSASTAVLVHKILSNVANDDMEPLRLTLRLEKRDYLEGVFCWKGFHYYKWRLGEYVRDVPALLEAVAKVRAKGPAEPVLKAEIELARARIIERIKLYRRAAEDTLRVYDTAYARLTRHGDPLAFRQFLLEAPSLFLGLGEKLGVIDHMVSFWKLRFPGGLGDGRHEAPPVELADIFADFETGLGLVQDHPEERLLRVN